MNEKPTRFTPPPVSRFFIFDWQYALDIYNATVLQFISVAFLILPMAINTQQNTLISIPLGLKIASITFILALIIIYLFCPRFIREYRDFGQYKLRQNSHRWIIWEFYNNLKSLSEWKSIVMETVSKDVSVELRKIKSKEIRNELSKSFTEQKSEADIIIYKPVNLNRDIYLPIRIEDKKMILCMEEADKKLPEKEKELFWILYTEAVKEKVLSRIVFWILIYSTIIIALYTIISYIFSMANN